MISSFSRRPLQEVAFFQEGPGLRRWQWTTDGMKVINVTNLLGDGCGTVDTTNTDKYISLLEFEERYKHFAVELNDIVVASSGNTYGKVGRITEENLPVMMNTSVIRFHSHDRTRLNDEYLYAFLRSPDFRDQVHQFVTGGAQPNFGPSHLNKMTIPVPDIHTQRQIGNYLSNYDQLMQNNRRRIQLLEQAARLLYKEWFVRLRFPGHERVKVRDGVPEGWERKRLGEIVATNVESYKANELPDEINYIDISAVKQGRIMTKNMMPSVEAPGRARRKAKSGDTIWSNVRPNLRAYALVLNSEDDDIFSTGFTILSPVAVPFTYLYLLVTTDEFVGHLVNHTTGASYPAVRPDDFERAIVLVPPKRVLKLFHDKTEPMCGLVHVLEKETISLSQARDLLLPRLMRGEVGASVRTLEEM